MFGFGMVEIGILLVAVSLWIVAIVDALRRPDEQWRAAGQDRFPWLLVLIFGGTLGAILYWANPRHAMKQLERRR